MCSHWCSKTTGLPLPLTFNTRYTSCSTCCLSGTRLMTQLDLKKKRQNVKHVCRLLRHLQILWRLPKGGSHHFLKATLFFPPPSSLPHTQLCPKIREMDSVWNLNKLLASLSVQKKFWGMLLICFCPDVDCTQWPGTRRLLHKAFLMPHVNRLSSSKAALLRHDLTTQRKNSNTESYNLPWK